MMNRNTDSLILEVIIHDDDIITRASAKVLNHVKIIPYKSPITFYVYGNRPSCFALPNAGESYNGSPYSTAFRQIEFCVHYKDYYKNYFMEKEVSWSTHKGLIDNAYFISPERFYNRLKLLLPESDSILSRKLDSIDITMTSPSRFFNDYWFVREYWEDSDRPPYTNFDNSYGMFFTIAKDKLTGQKLDSQSMDSLCNGRFYMEMKFKNW